MRINVAVPEEHVSSDVINAALEATTRLDEKLIRQGAVPTFKRAKDRVRWQPEPPGDEHFDHAGVVMKRGWGDCDDLACWHAASLRMTGQDRGAHAIVKQVGPKRWHAVVRRSDGHIEDPSRAAGMPGQGSAQISGAILPPMVHHSVVGTFVERPQLAVRPSFDRAGQQEAWEARTDLPWHWMPGKTKSDIAMVSLHKAPTANQAICGSIRGALRIGENDDPYSPENLQRLEAVTDAVQGAPFEYMQETYGPEIAGQSIALIGSIFGSIAHIAAKVVKATGNAVHAMTKPITSSPIAMGVMAAIPGIGTGVAAAIAAAHYGMKLKDALGHHVSVTPEQALDKHLKGEVLHFIDHATGKELVVKPPSLDKPALRPEMDPQWGRQRMPLHPSALPVSFTMQCNPIPG